MSSNPNYVSALHVWGNSREEISQRAIDITRVYVGTDVALTVDPTFRLTDVAGAHAGTSGPSQDAKYIAYVTVNSVPAKPAKLTHVVFEYGYDRHDLESKVLRTAAIYFGVSTRGVRIVSGESRANTSLRDGASKAFYGTFVTALVEE